MDIEEYAQQVEVEINLIKNELFEARQLLKYAFKKDIVDKKENRSVSPLPRKQVKRIK